MDRTGFARPEGGTSVSTIEARTVLLTLASDSQTRVSNTLDLGRAQNAVGRGHAEQMVIDL